MICLLAMTGLMGWTADVHGTYPPDALLIEELNEIQGHLFDENFRLTDSLCIELTTRCPDEPLGYLFRAVTLITEMIDQEEVLRPTLFDALLDTAEDLATRRMDPSSAAVTAWCWLIAGHANGYRSMFAARFGSVITAYGYGKRAAQAYEAGLELDSTLYDLYAGLGLFHYWKSAPAGILRSLGLIKDERERGILELQLAADSSSISRDFATSGLIWVWLNDRQYDSVLAMASQMLAKYPDGDAYLWALARANLGRECNQDALPYLTRLRERIAIEPGNYYNLIQLDWHIAHCWEKLQQMAKASACASRLREYVTQIPAKTKRKQQRSIA